ncbi:MAG: ATP-binding protein [Acidobacteriota bacterium]
MNSGAERDARPGLTDLLERLREMLPPSTGNAGLATRLEEIGRECEELEHQLLRLKRENNLLRENLSDSDQRLHQKLEEISLLRLIADLETMVLGAADPYDAILTQVVHLTGAENGSVMLLDRSTGRLLLKCAGGVRRLYRDKPLTFRIGEGIAGRVTSTGQAMRIDDVTLDSSFVPMDAGGPTVRSLFCLPLIVEDEVLGVINVSHSRPHAFTESTERTMHIASRYLAMALRSADLLEKQRIHVRLIEASENRYRTLVESVNDGFFAMDAGGRTRLVNAQFCRLVGYSKEEVYGLDDWRPLVHQAEWQKVSSILDAYKRDEVDGSTDLQHSFEFTMVTKQKREIAVHLHCRSAVLEFGRACIGVVRDMTEYRTMQSQQLQSEKLASLGTLLTGITHELNNKLTPILGYSQLLRDAGLGSKQDAHVKAIEKCATGAKAIVDSLLGFTRRSSLTREAVNVADLIREVLVLARPSLEHCHVQVEPCLADRLPPVLGSPHQLEQVLMNIVNNAIQAMEPQGGGILTITCGFTPETVWASISDTGPGIAAHVLPRIFDPFFSTKGDRKGTGLGLSVSYGIVKAHGGELRVQTTPGMGARFTIELPAMEVLEEPPGSAPAPPARETAAVRRRILVVDDEDLIGELIQEMLPEHDVEVALDGSAAQQVLAGRQFDLVFLDLRMPVVDGPTLYRWMAGQSPANDSRVIFTTGDTYDPDLEQFLRQTGRACLIKPFTMEELRSAVSECLRG